MYFYINGHFTTNNQISLFDRGLMFGDGFFETLRVINHSTYLWGYHSSRIENTSHTLKISLNLDLADLESNISTLTKLNKLSNALVKIIITRGDGSQGYKIHDNPIPNIMIMSFPHTQQTLSPITLYMSSIQCFSADKLSQYKTLQRLNSVMSKSEANNNNCFEGLMRNEKMKICEASSGNIFWCNNGKIFTPCLSCGAIAGIMRRKIMAMYEVITGEFEISDILRASEVFLSNASWITLPVAKIYQHPKHFDGNLISNAIRKKILAEQLG